MACLVNNYDEMKAYLKNKLSIYSFDNTSTTKDVVNALDHTTDNFGLHVVNTDPKDKGDDKRRYALKNGMGGFFTDTFLNWRVTDKVNKLFKRNKTEDEINAYRTDPDNIAKTEFGTKGHAVAQMIGELYYDSIMSGKEYDNTAALNLAKSGEYTFNKAQFSNLEQGVKEIIDEIFTMQKRIDLKGTVHIRFEQLLIDPTKDIGGTMDIIAIFSDKTATLYDYKFLTAGMSSTIGRGNDKTLVSDRFIYSSKKEAWKLQLGTYKKILLNRYGLRDIRATKVVPVWIDYKGDPSEKKVNKILIGKNQSEYLKYIHATYAKTTIPQIDALLKSRYAEIEKLKKQPNSDERNIKIARIEQSVYELIEGNNIEFMINDALEIAKYYYTKDDLTYDELNDVLNYLKVLGDFHTLFEENSVIISEQDSTLHKAILEVFKKQYDNVTVYDKLRNIKSIYGILFQKLLTKISSEENITLTDKSGRVVLSDDDFFTKTFLSTSESNNEIFQIAQKSFDASYQKMREDLEKFYDTLNKADLEVTKWLKSQGQPYSNLHKYIMNEYGNLHSKINGQFYKLRQNALAKKNAMWFFQHYKIKDKNRFGETYQEWYKRSKADYQLLLERRHAVLKQEDEEKYNFVMQNDMASWVAKNDLSLDVDGSIKNPDAWLYSRWLVLKESTIQKYKSSQYAFIEKNKPLLDYYETLLEANRIFQNILGYDSIGNNFLPKIRADYVEKLANGSIKSLTEDIKEIFSIREDETAFGQYDVETGEIDKRVPVFYTNPFVDQDGKVDITQQTKDITRAYLLFAKMAYNNKYMTEIEAKIQSLKTVLSSAKYLQTDEKGRTVFNFMHDYAVSNKSAGDTPTEQVFNNIVDYHLYGIRVQPFQNKPSFTQAAMKLKNYMGIKTLGLGVIGASAGYVAAQSQAWVEGRKGVIYTTDQWNKASLYQAKEFNKYHALAYFFGVHNDSMLQDIAKGTNPVHQMLGDRTVKDGVRKYINQRTLMRPFSYLDERIDNHIAVAMAQNYGIDNEGNVRRLKNLPEGTKSIWELFSYEKETVGLNISNEGLKKIIPQFRNIVRAGQKGIKGTMSDEDINYAQTNLILNLVSQFKTWMPGVINERFGKLKYNQILDAPQWGRYRALWNESEFRDGSNTALYVLYTTGNMLKYIAKDLVTFGPIRRLGGAKIPISENNARLYYNKYKQQNPNSKLTFEDFVEIKRAGIRGALIELQIFMAMSALIIAMRGDWDDDGEPMWKETWVAHKIFQMLNKASSEVAFTFNPLEYAKLFTNPMPVASLFIDTSKLLINTADEARDFVLGENNKKDNTGTLYYSIGILPGGFQLRRLLDLSAEDSKRER